MDVRQSISNNVKNDSELARPEESPFSLLLDLSDVDWWTLLEDLTATVVASGTSLRIKSGLMLEPDLPRRVRVDMGAWDPVDGRRIQQTRQGYLPYFAEVAAHRLLAEVRVIPHLDRQLSVDDIRRWECVSFSNVSAQLAQSLMDVSAAHGALIAGLMWSRDDAHAGTILWKGLILRCLIADKIVLEDYEDFPEMIDYSSADLTWSPTRSPEGAAAGFFYSDGQDIYVERSFSTVRIPPDLDLLPISLAPTTPLQRAIQGIGIDVVTRLSGHDLPDASASYRLPYIHFQYPDLLAVERKVRDYCLSTTQIEQKWVGFINHGYSDPSRHSIILASELVGALLGDFTPQEVVATAHGELQFSTGIAVSSSHKFRTLVNTAWIAEPGVGFRLSTAYIDASRSEYADRLQSIEGSRDLPEAWPAILDRANQTATGWTADGATARPRLYIPRSGATREFAIELVRGKKDHGNYNRAALGGRSLLVPLGGNMSWSAAAYVTIFVQVQLGLRGIRSLSGLWVD